MRTNYNTIKKIQGINNLETAMESFGLDFSVDRVPLYTNKGGLKKVTIEKEAILRTSKNGELSHMGIVSKKYPIIQPIEKFICFDSFAKEGIIEFVEGGFLGKGGKIYLTARIAGTLNLEAKKGYIVEQRITFVSSYDGSKANEIFLTPMRLVCSNGMVIPEKHTTSFRLKNTKNISGESFQNAILIIENAVNEYRRLDEIFMRLLETPVPENNVKSFVDMILPAKKEVSESYIDEAGNIEIINLPESSTRNENRRLALNETIYTGIGQEEIQGMNLWKLLNGVTCYVNNVEGEKKKNRFDFVHFGSGAELNERAFNVVTSVLDGSLVLS